MIQRFTYESSTVATTYHLQLAEVGAHGPRRLIVVLDGDDQFVPAVAAAERLSSMGKAPALLLFGIGYGGSYRSPLNKRGRDYTPTKCREEPMENGGAEAFHSSLGRELLPWAAARFDFAEDDLAITGNSLSGLFVLYALFHCRPLFKRGLAGSPSIWWDNRSILPIVTAAAAHSASAPRRLFLCAGEDDSPSMLSDLAALAEVLRRESPHFLSWKLETFPGVDHYSSLPSSFNSGFDWVYSEICRPMTASS